MGTLTRRHLLGTAAILPLAACESLGKIGGLVTDPLVGDLAAKVKTWVDGLGLLPSDLAGKVPGDVLGKVSGWLNDLSALAAAIGGTTSLAGAVPLVKQLDVVFTDIVDALPAGTLPASVTTLLSAAHSYLPVILKLAGLATSLFGAPRRSRLAAMPPEDARRVLIAAAATAAVRR